MKRFLLAAIAIGGAMTATAQSDTVVVTTDTLIVTSDTIRVGGIIIIKKSDGKDDSKSAVAKKKKKSSAVSTNWGVLDLGFANFNENTNFSSPAAQAFAPGITDDDLDLRNAKSVNVNIWILMQKINLYKHRVNFKWGLGLDLNNYRFDNELVRFQKNPTRIFVDSTLKNNVTKNKLAADYASIPAMLNFNFTPRRNKPFGLSAGVQVGYLYSARQKLKFANDDKEKLHGNFDLRKWKVSYIGELSLGVITFYGSYATRSMWEKGLDQTPYAVGIRLAH